VIAAIDRKGIDRVPIDFGGACCSIVDSPFQELRPYKRLCEYLGIKDYEEPISGPFMYDVCNIDERILQRFGVDIRYVYPNGAPLYFDPQGGAVVGVFGVRMKPVGYYGTPDRHPMRDFNTIEEVENYPFYPDPQDPVYEQDGFRERVLKLREETDYAIALELGTGGIGFTIDIMISLFGMERFLYNIKRSPDLHHAFLNKHIRATDGILDKIMAAAGDLIDIFTIFSDFGTMQGPFMSEEDYIRHIKPYEASLIGRIKRRAPHARVMMHSCGSIVSAIPHRAEVGLDVQNPMNPLAKNMEPASLKEQFGEMISFHGGIDIQRLLPFGTPKDITDKVREMVKIFGPAGGWIAAPSHNIQPDTPPENIVALYDALQEYGADF
jgi:uroporphyrinogen decarboxylase